VTFSISRGGKTLAPLAIEDDDQGSYADLLNKARSVAESIATRGIAPQTGSAKYIFEQSKALTKALPAPESVLGADAGPAYEVLELLEKNWPELARGETTGEWLILRKAGLWVNLMQGWPMNTYARMTAKFLEDRGLLGDKAILELGAGVGSTTRLISDRVGERYVRTDLFPQLLAKTKAPGTIARYDFNQPGSWRDLDAIFAVKALHCARDKKATLRYLYEMLAPGGTLVVGEGVPLTAGEIPWALDMCFGMFDGWWDVGGLLTRGQWLEHFEEVGFKDSGFSVLRSKQHDLGGIVWAVK